MINEKRKDLRTSTLHVPSELEVGNIPSVDEPPTSKPKKYRNNYLYFDKSNNRLTIYIGNERYYVALTKG